jgi:hypothetical protein
MSATVAAALKKIAVAILTDKKLRKAVLGRKLKIRRNMPDSVWSSVL